MSDLHHDQPRNMLERLRVQHQESNTMLAILMAGIAALFIIGIVVAYNYASKDVSTAHNPPPASTVTHRLGRNNPWRRRSKFAAANRPRRR